MNFDLKLIDLTYYIWFTSKFLY